MKKILFLFALILSVNNIFGQSNFGQPKDSANFDVKIDPDFFLLGTFSDYMGRFRYIDRENEIDRYYPYEEVLALYINDFIHQNYNIESQLELENAKHSRIISPSLAKKIHGEYFDEKGRFIDSKLDTNEKKYSFLLGCYLRYGEQLDGNIYKIQVANSPKDKQLYFILKELECDKIVYKFLRGNIPSSDIFYFVATPRMIKYFNTIDKLNKKLQDSFYDVVLGKAIKGNKRKRKIEEFKEEQNQIVKNLKAIFK
ncbi:hypothetical protein [Riemerella anatipestifer]|uniref:hypothetical protein n=1 Tax=Riemerella anatipestifer TaxID=34085 RepID=UPI00129DEDFE|nr:hypothetical protein [Riemerella anatipestifer]MBT0552399.1 hypothetical protein [Riemerella anatipestifer]MBT0554563.1 hypothetical protein [Riemerella anatipestifer]MCE3025122.1 hypothetical protein [Riemerella anatipestifer]MCU7543141.1 hypothetical protein [Riemerella anatipestifer]MCU7560766.1 hypothetical protein [Riemerella anatipestifer]